MPEPVDQILMRFPGPVTLNASRLKWALVLLGGLGFVALALFLRHVDRLQGPYEFWPGLVFFGFVALVAAIALMPGASNLKLDRQGFEIVTLFKKMRVSWHNAANFEITNLPIGNKAMLFFDYTPAPGEKPAPRWIAAIAGGKGGLPDTYGFSLEDLERLMTQWRERALR